MDAADRRGPRGRGVDPSGFGIDAGWDMRQAAQEDRQLLQALVSEIEANREELRYRSSQGASALRAHAKLIDLIGPQPEVLSVDSLSQLLRTSMAFGIVEIESAALEALLVAPSTGTPRRTRLVRLLRLFKTELEDHRFEDRPQWIDYRAELVRYLVTVSPFAFVWAESGLHGPTDFEVPVEDLLRDQQLEGLLSHLAMRAGQMTASIQNLMAVSDSMLALVSDELR